MSIRDQIHKDRTNGLRTKNSGSLKVAVLAVAATLLISAGALLWKRSSDVHVRTNREDLCPTDRPPSELLVLLFDMSDELTESQRLKIENEIQRILLSVPRFGLVEAYAVGTEHVPRPLVHLCNPGRGDDMSRFYQNPDLAQKKWQAFIQRISAELDALMRHPARPTSPIFETIQAISLRTFGLPNYDSLPKSLVIASDLIQNVPGKLSQYQNNVSFSTIEGSPYFSEIRSDLSQVEVTVLYIVRPRSPQPWPEHYRFWETYFKKQGATLMMLEPVHGGQ